MKSHFILWLSIILLAALAAPMLSSEQGLKEMAQHELGLMKRALGAEETNEIIATANKYYEMFYVQSGILKALKTTTTSETDRMSAGSNLGSAFYHFTTAMNNYLLAFITMTYLSLLRVAMILKWVPFLLPFGFAAIADGVTKYHIVHSTVTVQNPVKFKLFSHAMMLLCGLPFLYFLSPIVITPYFFLGWAFAASIVGMSLISGMAPLSYK